MEEQDNLQKSLYLITEPIDIDTLIKGAFGLNRYINDPSYRPKTVAYQRKNGVVFGTVYEKDKTAEMKKHGSHQHALEKHGKKLPGKKVKVSFKDKKGNHYEDKHGHVVAHNDKHLHVQLSEDIRNKQGKIAHKKGKVIKVPKTHNPRWLHHEGKNRAKEHIEDKTHDKLVNKDRQQLKKQAKKDSSEK